MRFLLGDRVNILLNNIIAKLIKWELTQASVSYYITKKCGFITLMSLRFAVRILSQTVHASLFTLKTEQQK